MRRFGAPLLVSIRRSLLVALTIYFTTKQEDDYYEENDDVNNSYGSFSNNPNISAAAVMARERLAGIGWSQRSVGSGGQYDSSGYGERFEL